MLTKKKVRKVNPDKFVRYDEGAQMYHMSLSKFQQLAKNEEIMKEIGLDKSDVIKISEGKEIK